MYIKVHITIKGYRDICFASLPVTFLNHRHAPSRPLVDKLCWLYVDFSFFYVTSFCFIYLYKHDNKWSVLGSRVENERDVDSVTVLGLMSTHSLLIIALYVACMKNLHTIVWEKYKRLELKKWDFVYTHIQIIWNCTE